VSKSAKVVLGRRMITNRSTGCVNDFGAGGIGADGDGDGGELALRRSCRL